MSDHPIESLMQTAMNNIKEIVDVNTVIGKPIVSPDGTTIIPVSKVSFGFASGGSDFNTKNPMPEKPANFGGGSGAGVSINPIAFIVISNGDVKLLQLSEAGNVQDRAVAMVPELVDKITALFKKDKKQEENTATTE